jgi:hypothetical protein
MPALSNKQQFIASIIAARAAKRAGWLAGQDSESDSDNASMLSESSSSSSSSSISSSSSSSSFDSDANMSVDADTDDEYMAGIAKLDSLLKLAMETRVIFPNTVHKNSQLYLVLEQFRLEDPCRFRHNLHVTPNTFDSLLELIQNHDQFQNNSNIQQAPVRVQLAITLFRFGHFGNAASVEAIAQWAGVSVGLVVKATRRVIVAFITLHDQAIRWPNAQEKEAAKQAVEDMSCFQWRNGFCMVDGTVIPLFAKPGHHGEAYYDRKGSYSLAVQVCLGF